MRISNITKLKPKKLIVFDLDGTLARTKSPMDKETANLLKQLLQVKKVAVIGGGKYEIFQMQLLHELTIAKKLLENLFIFPTTATACYIYKNGWKKIYALTLSKKEVAKIKDTFERVFREIGYRHPPKTYGELIEDRGTQVSFSVYGQDIVAVLGQKGVKMKEAWKKSHTPVKMKIAKMMARYLPEFEVRAAGFTTIDVTQKGIDKAYGLMQIKKHVHADIRDMLFVGDAIFPGGNDYAVVRTGVDYIPVRSPVQTKAVMRALLRQK